MPKGSLKSAAIVLCLLLVGAVFAAETNVGTKHGTDAISVPQLINFQGKLTDGSGGLLTGPYDLFLEIYDVASGGTALWSETQTDVQVTDGLFNVLLGSVNPITSIPDGPDCYLQVTVETQVITPRMRMVSAPYTYNAQDADDAANLGGVPAANHITISTAASGDLTGPYPGPTIAQKGATDGQVLKWNSGTSSWQPANDQTGGGTGVTSVGQGPSGAIVCNPNPITTVGTVDFSTTWGDARYVNEGQNAGGDLTGTYPSPAIAQKSAANGQVLKWNGSAWMPQNDLTGGTGTVTQINEGTGIDLTPNQITTTGTVAFDQSWGDDRYIRNQYSSAQNPGRFWIATTGRAQQFYAATATTNAPAIWGEGGTYSAGVYAKTARPGDFAVNAKHSSSSGTGIMGVGNNTTGLYLSTGSGGAFTGTSYGAYCRARNTSGTGIGVYARSSTSSGFGVKASNSHSSGTGVLSTGNNQAGLYLTTGSGGALTGTEIGVFGHATNTSGTRGGGYFTTNLTYVWVGVSSGGTSWKVNGSGLMGTCMKTRAGDKSLIAPEMPEPWFEDVGEGQLADGHCRVNLDPLFLDCGTVTAQHPMKVFVQLEDDCNGVYVKKDGTGFNVCELQDGTSDAKFSYRVLVRWKGYEDLRFPDALPRLETVQAETAAEEMQVEVEPRGLHER